MKLGFSVFLLLILVTAPAIAGERLTVRMVEASNDGSGVHPEAKDIAGVLNKSLVYKDFALLACASLTIPVKGRTIKLSSYSVTCSGKQDSMKIVVRRGKKEVLNTTVKLQDKKLVILGGFPSKKGKLILVFLVK